EAFAARLRATGVLSDPWLDGAPRFEEAPVVLGPEEAAALAEAAEAVVAALNELVRILVDEPALLDRLGLTPHQRIIWHASAPPPPRRLVGRPRRPHGPGPPRPDAFSTAEAAKSGEDTGTPPGGGAGAVLPNRPAAARALADPNGGLLPRLAALVERVAPRK